MQFIRTLARSCTKTKREKKGEREKRKGEEKGYKYELRRRIFGAEQRSMDSTQGDYPMHYEGDRLLL